MTEKTYDDEFLQRLMAIAGEMEIEEMPESDAGEGDGDDDPDEEVAAAAIALEEQIAPLLAQRRQHFAEIVQWFSDKRGSGPIETLEREALLPLVGAAVDATEKYDKDDVDSLRLGVATPLRMALKAHHEIGELIGAIEDEELFGHNEDDALGG